MPVENVNGIKIEYEVQGEGEVLVLISGLGYPRWQWHKMVPFLAEHFKVVTFDNRGVGGSDKPAGPYTAQMLAADTIGLLDTLGIDKATFVGHSMGGYIAQAIGLDYPGRVNRLVLCSTNFGGPNHVPVTPEAMAVLSDTTSDPLTRFTNGLKVSTAPGWADANPEIVEEWVTWRVTNPLDLAGYQSQMAIGLGLIPAEACFEGKLHQITAPTLILSGEFDKVVPPENAALLQAKIAGSEVAILPNAGHFFPIETPEYAAKQINQFMN